MPGSFEPVYNGSRAVLDAFSYALCDELEDSGVHVSVLIPAATEFERADMRDTKFGAAKKDDPADVAKAGFEAMMNGEVDVVAGFKNKVWVATS
jgi:short-subunit dehydrogenase